MTVKVGGVDGKHDGKSKGTEATGGGRSQAGERTADNEPKLNDRIPPGVLNDAALQSHAHHHGQTHTPHEGSVVGRNFGGVESLHLDDGGGPIGDSDESETHKGND